ncbi:MAG: hypothetical protein HY907_15775 [Deltaproteobacteria bacterium]|nr:hypothetical protein [Deltaproteobacteria bacterium]
MMRLGLLVLLLVAGCRGKHHVVLDDWVPPPDAGVGSGGREDAGEEPLVPGVAGDGGESETARDGVRDAGDEAGGEEAEDSSEGEAGPEAGEEGEGGVEAPAMPDGYGVVERADDGTVAVPAENRERGTRPGPESAEALAHALLAAIAAGDPGMAVGTVFPLEAFEVLKDLPDPAAYRQRMVRWYEEDVQAERERIGEADDLTFDRLQFGYCTWQDEHTEGNLLPYWSCRHNKLYARADGRPVTIEIHALINWGTNWYIAHLGPVRR